MAPEQNRPTADDGDVGFPQSETEPLERERAVEVTSRPDRTDGPHDRRGAVMFHDPSAQMLVARQITVKHHAAAARWRRVKNAAASDDVDAPTVAT